MSLSFLDNVDYNGKKPNFNRDLFDTVAQMKAFSENYLPDVFIASCKEDGKQYVYNKNNTVDETTGKWRLLSSGGSGGGAVDSVNGKTGVVTLTASDVGALSDSTDIPSKTSDLTNDSNFVVDANYQHTDNNFTNDLKTAYDGAVTDKHTHSNKTVLDAITSEVKSGYDSAVTNSHSHDNKAVIDKFTESADGKPLYDGSAIGGSGGTTIVVGNGGDSYYSEDEIVIGSYFGKPLYRRIIDCGKLPNNSHKEVVTDMLVSSVDIKRFDGYADNGSFGLKLNNSYNTLAGQIQFAIKKTGTNIIIYIATGNDRSSYNGYVILEYTKTTDTANSSPIARPSVYSTDEVCVGTWIDGKPLYRKVWDCTSPSTTNTVTNVITDVPSDATVINLYGTVGYNFSINTQGHVMTTYSGNGLVGMTIYNDSRKNQKCNIVLEYTKTT